MSAIMEDWLYKVREIVWEKCEENYQAGVNDGTAEFSSVLALLVKEWDGFMKYNHDNKMTVWGYGAMENAVRDAKRLLSKNNE